MAGSVKRDMTRAFFVLSTLVFILVCYFGFGWPKIGQEPARAAAISWTGLGDGSGWEDAANWSSDPTLPSSSDDVTIDNATVTVSTTADFATLTIGSGVNTTELILLGNVGIGGDITINNNGTLTQKNTNTQTISGTLTINSGGTLTHTDNDTAQLYEVDFNTATITINSGGFIDADAKGYTGGGATSDGNGPGGGTYGSAVDGAGGAHTGNGGDDAAGDAGGVGYCDITNPSTIGSGGAGTSLGSVVKGGDGGGFIKLAASGNITINGTITADGADGGRASAPTRDSGAGAGGGVNISADSILGTPESFTVSGGGLNPSNTLPKNGTGGGGCILLSYTTSNSITVTSIDMSGGIFNNITDSKSNQRGGAGAVLIKQSGSNGDLYSINQGEDGSNKSNKETIVSNTSLTLDNITVASSSIFTVTSTQTLTFSDGDPFTASTGATGTLRVASGGKLTTVDSFSIKYGQLEIFSSGNWTNSSTLALAVGQKGILSLGGYASSSDPWIISTLTIDNGGFFTHAENSTVQENVINFSATTMTINSGGSIDVDGKGFAVGTEDNDGNAPPGTSGEGKYYVASQDGSGGAHSGDGGTTSAGAGEPGGVAYCNTSNPQTMGAGGGGSGEALGFYAGNGGGLIKLNILGTLTINGSITADGENGNGSGGSWAGAGAGGGINIVADTLAGTPSNFTAVGGVGGSNAGGSGGGGCVYIIYTTSCSIDSGDISVLGGVGGGGNGSDGATPMVVQDNIAPTASSLSPSQNINSNTIVTVTTTVADTDSDVTNLVLEYSTDNVTWVSSTMFDVSQGGGEGDGVVTSTGAITDIDTDNDGSVDLIIEWNIGADLSTDEYTNVYFRIIPNDGISNGSTVTSDSFAVDRKVPTNLGALTVGTVTYASAALTFGAQAVDTNFKEYKIFYKAGASGVTESDTAHTSSSDSNLGPANYGGASATTISGLNANTQYFVNIWAYDHYGNSLVGSEEADFTTLASGATTPTVNNPTATTLDVTISESGNPANTTFAIYNETLSSYVATDGSSVATAVYQTTSTWGGAIAATGLSVNTPYQFSVVARNGVGIDSVTSTPNNIVYTAANEASEFIVAGNGPNQIDATWSANGNPAGTEYNITLVGGTSSGWITGFSYSFTGLEMNTSYAFTLKARNSDNVETATISESASTGGIGVGSPVGGSGDGSVEQIIPPECEGIEGIECCTDDLCTPLHPSGLVQIYFCGESAGEYINGQEMEECGEENLELRLNVENVNLVAIKPTTKINDLDFSGISFSGFYSPQYYGLRNGNNCFSVRFQGEGGTVSRYACVILDTETVNPQVVGINTIKYARKTGNIVSSRPIFSGTAEPNSIVSLSFKEPENYRLAFYNNLKMAGLFTIQTRTGKIILKQEQYFSPSFSLPIRLAGIILQTAEFAYAQISDDIYTVTANDVGVWNFESPFYLEEGTHTVYLQSEDSAGNISDWVDFSVVIGSVVQQCGNGIIEEGEECDEGNANGAVHTACNESCELWRNCTEMAGGFLVLETSVGTTQYPFDGKINCSLYFEGYTYFACDENPVSFLGHEYDIDTVGYITVNHNCASNEECENASCVPKTIFCGDGICNGTENIFSCPADCGLLSGCGDGFCNPEKENCQSCSLDCGSCQEEPPKEELEDPEENPEEEPPAEENNEDGITDEINKTIENVVDTITRGDYIPDSVKNTVNAIIDVGKVIADDFKKQIIDPIVNVAKETYKQVQKVIDNPQVETVNERVIAPSIVIAGAANVAVGFQFPSLVNLLRYLFSQPLLWFRRRKQKGWGIVYNAFTKQPLDLATVRIIDSQTEKVVRTQVTDKEGRYFLVLNPGIYKIEVTKTGFEKGSEILQDKKEDDKYKHLYHAEETIKITEEKSEVNYNVPLDPVGEDKPTSIILKEHARKVMQETGSLVGLGVSVTSFVISPTPLIGGLVIVHVVFYGIFRILVHGRMPQGAGSVVDQKTGNPLERVVVRVFDSAYNKLVSTVITDQKGKYGVLVGPSKYYVTYDKPGYEEKQSEEIDLSSVKTNGIGGVITRNEKMVKMGKGGEVQSIKFLFKANQPLAEKIENIEETKYRQPVVEEDKKEIGNASETIKAVEVPEASEVAKIEVETKPKLKLKNKEKANIVKEKVVKKKDKNVKFEATNFKKEKPSEVGLNVEDMMAGEEPDRPNKKKKDIFG